MIKSTDSIKDFPRQFNALETSLAELRARVDLHERWIKQIAKKVGITLEE